MLRPGPKLWLLGRYSEGASKCGALIHAIVAKQAVSQSKKIILQALTTDNSCTKLLYCM